MRRAETPGRRLFLRTGAAAGALALPAPSIAAAAAERRADLAGRLRAAVALPALKRELFPRPVRLASVELLQAGSFFLVRARSEDGALGLAEANAAVLRSAWPILVKRVAPFFAGKDARDLDALIEGVYVHQSNYKWQGLPFWACVASVELALLDLLGHVAGRSVGELLGTVRRREVEVYRASGNRGNTAEAEIEYLHRIAEEDGARAIKFRLGGRMRHDQTTTIRDQALIRLTRKTFGPGMILYADGNGSFDVPQAIATGRLMEEQGFRFYEEPLPFDHYEETREVADALDIPVAGGEEESSLRQFRSMIENGVLQVVQPDLFYFGGVTRALRVARMAEAAGLECTPHMSGGGLGFLYAAHFASFAPAHGPHQEYKGKEDELPVSSPTSPLRAEKGVVRVPTGPGLGVTFEPSFLRQARLLSA